MSLWSDDRVTIIAEVGSNHNGNLDTALQLIDVSADCGADVVKFQSFLVDQLLAADDPNYERLKTLELPREWYPVLMAHCRERGVAFLSTATNETTLGWMEEFGAAGYKVASCNITHRPLLDRLIDFGKPVIVSTGMAELQDVIDLARHFEARSFSSYAFLHCIAQYPTPPEEMRLKNITVLREVLSCPVGLSDHSHGSSAAVAAVALGARIVEKHISLDKAGMGLDHEVAVLPDAFAAMCSAVREVEGALVADFTPDRECNFWMRRAIRFTKPLPEGALIGEDDLKVTRPEDGLQPKYLGRVVGSTLTEAVAAEQPVQWALLREEGEG